MPLHAGSVFSSLEVFGRGERGEGLRVLLLPAGEQSSPSLGDPVECALRVLSGRLRPWRFGYLRGAVAPGWYADLPADASSPERSVLDAASCWSAQDRAPLFLMGFSKSGFAALSILSRHWRTGLFAGAAAWDAPLMLSSLSRKSMVRSFRTEAVFARHRLVDRVGELATAVRTAGVRLALDGFVTWGVQMRAFDRLLRAEGVPRSYTERRAVAHAWDHEWMDRCASALAAPLDPGHASGPPEQVR